MGRRRKKEEEEGEGKEERGVRRKLSTKVLSCVQQDYV